MIKQHGLRVIPLVIAVFVLGACSSDDGADYCKNHYVFHPDHLDSIASLNIEISENGDLNGHLTVPRVVIGDMPDQDLKQMFGNPERSFTLQSEASCELSLTDVAVPAENLVANYVAGCGPDNKLGQVNVALFDQLTNLDEVVVSVTTPATAKHFGISRQCDKPIFRLEKK